MLYRISGGIGFILLGLSMAGNALVSNGVTGVILVVAGVALLAGI